MSSTTLMSGHGVMVGGKTRKPVIYDIRSRLCNYCVHWRKHNPVGPVPAHVCYSNHTGSSGSMEPIACLQMVMRFYTSFNVVASRLCCDDDASTRGMLKWNNTDYMTNNNTDKPPMVEIKKGKDAGNCVSAMISPVDCLVRFQSLTSLPIRTIVKSCGLEICASY